MRSFIGMGTCWIMVLCQQSMGEPTRRAVSPWHARSDELPALAHEVEVALEIDRRNIVTFESVIARITLTNSDDKPLTVEVRKDGAPKLLASLVAHGNGEFERHHQWLRTSGPHGREITLAPGESTAGEILILFGGPPTGFPFAEPGRYSVKFACQPDRYSAPVYTNEVDVLVVQDQGDNAAFLDELSELSYAYYGWDRESVVRDDGENYIIGIRLLKKIIKVQKPHRVDPDNEKELRLIESLGELLARYPDSSYAGYIERFLGLMHCGSFGYEFSRSPWKDLPNPKGPGPWTKPGTRFYDDYRKGLAYLTRASKRELWPRTTAVFHLAALHAGIREWDKTAAFCDTLRRKYPHVGGERLASELEDDIKRYRAKLERRKREEDK